MQTITISKTYNKEEAFERFVELYKKDKNSIYDKDSEARELGLFLGLKDVFEIEDTL